LALRRNRDPLAPTEFVLSAILGLAAISFAFAVLISVTSGHGAFRGEEQPCVAVRDNSGTVSRYLGSHWSTEGDTDVGPPRGTKLYPDRMRVCAEDPSAGQQWWYRLSVWPSTLYAFGTMTAAWLLARTARRRGLFDPAVTKGVERLGVVLATGSAASAVVTLLAERALADSLLPQVSVWDLRLAMDWSGLLFGIGLVTVGRVLVRATAMREELDATV
jgi:hypothetical protein